MQLVFVWRNLFCYLKLMSSTSNNVKVLQQLYLKGSHIWLIFVLKVLYIKVLGKRSVEKRKNTAMHVCLLVNYTLKLWKRWKRIKVVSIWQPSAASNTDKLTRVNYNATHAQLAKMKYSVKSFNHLSMLHVHTHTHTTLTVCVFDAKPYSLCVKLTED